MRINNTIVKNVPIISVIIPVYNVERYLYRCVDSILAQTYPNLEIILVDDGSPDRSGEICDEYAQKDSRIKVIHQKNGGISAARNAGLEICTGDYVAFVDSDDYVMPEMYEKMLCASMEHNVDVCICQWQYEYSDGRHPITQKIIDQSVYSVKTSRELAHYFYKGVYDVLTAVSPCNKLYRRTILDNIRFSGRYMEDQVFHNKLFSNEYTVFVLPDLFYIYTENPDSLTHQSFNQHELRFLDVLQERYFLYRDDPFMRYESLVRYCNIYIEYDYKAREQRLLMPDRSHFKHCVCELLHDRSCSLKFYIRMALFLVSPNLYHTLLSR